MSDDAKPIAKLAGRLRVKPGSEIVLARDFDPGFKDGVEGKEEGRELLAAAVELLAEYQARLAAQDTHGVLVVLQGIDAAGKDGTIRHVMSGVNPQGVRVESFKAPSPGELDQDFLRGFAIHGYPEVPAYPASHGCVRVPMWLATTLYEQIPMGGAIYVYA